MRHSYALPPFNERTFLLNNKVPPTYCFWFVVVVVILVVVAVVVTLVNNLTHEHTHTSTFEVSLHFCMCVWVYTFRVVNYKGIFTKQNAWNAFVSWVTSHKRLRCFEQHCDVIWTVAESKCLAYKLCSAIAWNMIFELYTILLSNKVENQAINKNVLWTALSWYVMWFGVVCACMCMQIIPRILEHITITRKFIF